MPQRPSAACATQLRARPVRRVSGPGWEAAEAEVTRDIEIASAEERTRGEEILRYRWGPEFEVNIALARREAARRGYSDQFLAENGNNVELIAELAKAGPMLPASMIENPSNETPAPLSHRDATRRHDSLLRRLAEMEMHDPEREDVVADLQDLGRALFTDPASIGLPQPETTLRGGDPRAEQRAAARGEIDRLEREHANLLLDPTRPDRAEVIGKLDVLPA